MLGYDREFFSFLAFHVTFASEKSPRLRCSLADESSADIVLLLYFVLITGTDTEHRLLVTCTTGSRKKWMVGQIFQDGVQCKSNYNIWPGNATSVKMVLSQAK